jgi:hypothetical protein
MIKVCPRLAAVQRAMRHEIRFLGAIGEFLLVRLTTLTLVGRVRKRVVNFAKVNGC